MVDAEALRTQELGTVTFDHESTACEAIARFARADLVGAAAGCILVIVANAVWVQRALLWIVPAALAVLVAVLIGAARAAGRGGLLVAIALITAGNWLVALIVPIALPFMWPILAIVVVMPLVLAAPFVPLRVLIGLIIGAAAVAAAVAAIGLEADDGGAIPDVNDDLEFVAVVGALAAMMVPLGLIVWLNNRSQREALDAALRLNTELETSQHRLRESRRRVVEAGDAARSRIERDLHDGAQQQLVALGMKTRLLAAHFDAERTADATALVPGLVADVDRAVETLRELAHGIYPPVLEAHGLGDAIDAAARRSVDPVVVTNGIGARRLSRAIEEALYFTALEAIANAGKHAAGAEVRVVLADVETGGQGVGVELRVEDDGPGFDPETIDVSHGVANMRDRVESVGGTFEFTSPSGRGATLRATVPVS